MVALLLILRNCGVAAKNTLFKHFLQSDRPQLSSARTKNQLSNVPSEIFNLKRNRQRNLHEQICNFREQVVRAGCKLLRANCQSKYQHCGGSLQSCAEKNIRFDCNRGPAFINKVFFLLPFYQVHLLSPNLQGPAKLVHTGRFFSSFCLTTSPGSFPSYTPKHTACVLLYVAITMCKKRA